MHEELIRAVRATAPLWSDVAGVLASRPHEETIELRDAIYAAVESQLGSDYGAFLLPA